MRSRTTVAPARRDRRQRYRSLPPGPSRAAFTCAASVERTQAAIERRTLGAYVLAPATSKTNCAWPPRPPAGAGCAAGFGGGGGVVAGGVATGVVAGALPPAGAAGAAGSGPVET